MSDDLVINLVPNLENIISHDPVVKAHCLEVAEQVAAVARSLAPVDSGAYVDSIAAEETPGGARAYSDDYKATWIEFGAPNNNLVGKYVFHRAGEATGLPWKKQGG